MLSLKFKRFFNIWTGFYQDSKYFFGVFDILTLGIGGALNWLLNYSSQNAKTPLGQLKYSLFLIFNIPQLLIRYCSAMLITILASPLIILAHIISYMYDPILDFLQSIYLLFPILLPIRHLIESHQGLYSRILHSLFVIRLVDTYFTWTGDLGVFKTRHFGIFDYLTLGIPALLFMAFPMAFPNSKPLLVLNIILLIVRCISGIFVTLFALPIIIGVHLISSIIAAPHGDSINEFIAEKENECGDTDQEIQETDNVSFYGKNGFFEVSDIPTSQNETNVHPLNKDGAKFHTMN
jgi:hypothetical protein